MLARFFQAFIVIHARECFHHEIRYFFQQIWHSCLILSLFQLFFFCYFTLTFTMETLFFQKKFIIIIIIIRCFKRLFKSTNNNNVLFFLLFYNISFYTTNEVKIILYNNKQMLIGQHHQFVCHSFRYDEHLSVCVWPTVNMISVMQNKKSLRSFLRMKILK